MLGDIYIKALSTELKESFEEPKTEKKIGYQEGLLKAITMIKAIDKKEVDDFMNNLMNTLDNMPDDNSL
jgi:hypothetical protein